MTDAAVACMIWNTVAALYTTLVASRADPIFGTLTPTAVLLCHTMVAFVI